MNHQNSNPYFNINGISDPKMFFNRETDIDLLLDALFADSAQCQSIVGQHKIGKTSLVQQLARPATMKRFGIAGNNYVFVYIDCERRLDALESRKEFYHLLLNELYVKLSKLWPKFVQDNPVNLINPSSWQEEWDRVLQELNGRNIYVFVILDKFDVVIMQDKLHEGMLFGSLRAYGSNPDFQKFAWITCTVRPLHILFEEAYSEFKISKALRQSKSDFCGIFPIIHYLRLFEQEDIDKLITVPSAGNSIDFSQGEKQAILRFGGRFPYFIQRVCHRFFEARQKVAVNHELILQQCIKDSTPIWTVFWEELDTRQQKLLHSIASGYPEETSGSILESLKDAALVFEDRGRLSPFSEEFGRFVREHHHAVIPEIGKHLFGRYKVLDKPGKTNHSVVLKAEDELLDRIVAIKLLYLKQELGDEIVKKLHNNLLREARILAKLEHKNIGKVYTAELEPLAVIMQWIEGRSLDDLLEENNHLPAVDTIKIGIHLTDALSYAHAKGITHRDVKPSNIILNTSGEPILIDFDIARSAYHHTITSSDGGLSIFVGTKPYSAPEQFEHPEFVGSPADVFALGVVLYEALTDPHQKPYQNGNNPKYYNGQLPKPARYDISEPLYHVLCTSLCQDPTQRPSALELHTQLQTYLTVVGENNGVAEWEQ